MQIITDAEKSLTLTSRQLCDLELILNGGFAPLNGFLTEQDYNTVVNNCRLTNNQVWPIPVTLDVSETFAKTVQKIDILSLRDEEGVVIAKLTVTDIYKPNKELEAKKIYGTIDTIHPAVNYLYNLAGEYYLGGPVELVNMPRHYDFTEDRRNPAEVKKYFADKNITNVVGFQTRNPMHRAHQELTLRAAKKINGHVLIHPVVGMTKPGDIDHYTRVKCYKKLLNHYPKDMASLSLLPLAMRMGGPREALWHALIRKNYGCTHFIIGRDHAGPGKDKNGNDFYGPYDAQDFVAQYRNEIGIEVIPFDEVMYVKNQDCYMTYDEIVAKKIDKANIGKISGTEFRRRLQTGAEIPSWFSYPEIIAEIRKTHPSMQDRGLTVFFTGLSGAGKSTIANALLVKLMELTDRSITLLDGDIVRNQLLSNKLGFSKEDRDINIKRIGFIASEITKHKGIAICAPIAPYEEARQSVRQMISTIGGFVEVYISTPLSTCEDRDPKGLYKKVRSGEIKNFTGVDDPYEKPSNPELSIDTTNRSVVDCVMEVINKLSHLGYLHTNNTSIKKTTA